MQVAPPAPPSASFTWFPESPQVGEPVSLVSSSTDAESAITGFAWALGGGATFQQGRPTLTTSFSTPGPHLVLLRVTDAAGRSSQAAETISVRHHRATLMQPFPIVRIAGRETRAGVRLTLLTVTAPVTSRVTVSVRGGKGRSSSESRLATVRKPTASTTVVMSFPRFARPLKAGSVLEVRVTKAGQIGKLTRFIPHRGKLPTRQDICLGVSGKPAACPSS
jgi:PKD repeat protein